MATKWREKEFWEHLPIRLCIYPVGQIFCRNHSSSLCFQNKRVFAFYAEIQAGCQKWRENNFGENLPVDSPYTL